MHRGLLLPLGGAGNRPDAAHLEFSVALNGRPLAGGPGGAAPLAVGSHNFLKTTPVQDVFAETVVDLVSVKVFLLDRVTGASLLTGDGALDTDGGWVYPIPDTHPVQPLQECRLLVTAKTPDGHARTREFPLVGSLY